MEITYTLNIIDEDGEEPPSALRPSILRTLEAHLMEFDIDIEGGIFYIEEVYEDV